MGWTWTAEGSGDGSPDANGMPLLPLKPLAVAGNTSHEQKVNNQILNSVLRYFVGYTACSSPRLLSSEGSVNIWFW